MTIPASPTLFDLVAEMALRGPASRAIVVASEPHSTLTYAELVQRSEQMAEGLYALGLRKGDTIAVWLPNGSEFVFLSLAAARLGLLFVPLNTRYGTEEVSHLLIQSEARGVVIASHFLDRDYGRIFGTILQGWAESGQVSNLDVVITVGSPTEAIVGLDSTVRCAVHIDDLGTGVPLPANLAEVAEDDLANAFGTSGTTSFPKLALHGHRATTQHAKRSAEVSGLTPDDIVLAALPFCGTFGFVTLAAALAAGSTVVILPNFRPDEALKAIRDHRVTHLTGTIPIFESLFARSATENVALDSLTRGIVAGSTVDALLRTAEEDHGIVITNVYGSSEIFALAAMPPATGDIASRSVAGGRLVEAGMQVRVVDPMTGDVMKTGESGELQFRGATVTPGYLNNDEATARAFTSDGWYRTGDRGVAFDAANFEYQSRLADTLRLSGFLVNPVEIEAFLTGLPGVEEAAVVGIPQPQDPDEERAVAFVVADGAVTAQALVDQCRGRLANFKVPAQVIFLDRLPTTPSPNGEKVQRNRLRDIAIAGASGEG